MILTLTMNPAVGIGYTVDTLKIDTVNRTKKVSKTPGGKGLNVSRVLKQLGSPVLATGLLGGHIGAFIKEKLDEVGLQNDFYPIQSETRNCIAILHEGSQTEILEAGPTITPEEQAGFLAHFDNLLKEVDLITISGSLPSGMDDDLYATIIEKAAKANVPVLLDTSGKTLKIALEASTKPALIKPNQEELAGLLGVPEATTVEELKEQLNSPLFNGVEWVVVSLGSKGALAKHEGAFYQVNIPKVNAVNPVGSGDSTIAGLAHAIAKGESSESILKTAVTAGTLNAMEAQTGFINMDNFDTIFNAVTVEKV